MTNPESATAGNAAMAALLGAFGVTQEDWAKTVQSRGAAGQDDIEYVPWMSASFGRRKDIDQVKPSNPTQADRQAAVEAPPDLMLATPEEIEYGQFSVYPDGRKVGFGGQARADARAEAQAEIVKQWGNPADGDNPSTQLRNAAEVVYEYKNMTNDQIASIAADMIDKGLLDENYTMADFGKVWAQLVGDAIDHYKVRPSDGFTPLDMLDLNYGDGSAIGSKGPAGPKVASVIDKTVSISTNDQARNLLRGVLAQKLGRRPTQVEIDDFQAALNEAQRANPYTRTTTNTYAADGSRIANSYTEATGGLDADEFADEQTDWRDPDSEYGRYQAASTYYNALISAIRGPGVA